MIADVGAIAGLISSLQAATEISKGMLQLRDDVKLQSKVIELQTAILAAQSSALAAQSDQLQLLDRIRELETQTAKLEAWEAEKQRYQLHDFGGSTFAYVLKEEMSNGEPMHRLCASCYQQDQKSILQFGHRTSGGQDRYDCPSCKQTYYFGAKRPHSHPPTAKSGW